MKGIFRLFDLFRHLLARLVRRRNSVQITTEDTNHDGSIDKVTVVLDTPEVNINNEEDK